MSLFRRVVGGAIAGLSTGALQLQEEKRALKRMKKGEELRHKYQLKLQEQVHSDRLAMQDDQQAHASEEARISRDEAATQRALDRSLSISQHNEMMEHRNRQLAHEIEDSDRRWKKFEESHKKEMKLLRINIERARFELDEMKKVAALAQNSPLWDQNLESHLDLLAELQNVYRKPVVIDGIPTGETEPDMAKIGHAMNMYEVFGEFPFKVNVTPEMFAESMLDLNADADRTLAEYKATGHIITDPNYESIIESDIVKRAWSEIEKRNGVAPAEPDKGMVKMDATERHRGAGRSHLEPHRDTVRPPGLWPDPNTPPKTLPAIPYEKAKSFYGIDGPDADPEPKGTTIAEYSLLKFGKPRDQLTEDEESELRREYLLFTGGFLRGKVFGLFGWNTPPYIDATGYPRNR